MSKPNKPEWQPISTLPGGTWAILWDSKPPGGVEVFGCYMVGLKQWWTRDKRAGKADIIPTHWIPLPGPPPSIKDPRYEPIFVNVDPLLKEAIASAQLEGAVHAKRDALTKAKEDNTPSMACLKNGSDAQPDSANTEKRKPSEENILDFTVEQVRDNPAWALAVFRHQMKQKSCDRIHDINQIGGLQEENARLTKLLDKLDEVIYFFDCTADTKKCNQRIDDIVCEYREYKDHD